MRTFHVKAYHLGSPRNNWIAIGSNNLTAGGLFSNYEASMASPADEELAEDFMEMFDKYSDTRSTCCKRADRDFVDLLLTNGYIQQEKVLAKRSVAEEKNRKAREKDDILFGRDSATVLPHLAGIAPVSVPANVPAPDDATLNTPVQPLDEHIETDMDYLIRHIPRAGDRSQQVHFTMDILRNYFKLSTGDQLTLQQINDIYSSHPIEHRRVVYSQRNKNVKIEVSAAEVLNTHYPTDENKRPILLFKRVNPTMFEYMLLMDDDSGYNVLNNRLLGLEWHHRSLRYDIIDTGTMLTIWDDCPLI